MKNVFSYSVFAARVVVVVAVVVVLTTVGGAAAWGLGWEQVLLNFWSTGSCFTWEKFKV